MLLETRNELPGANHHRDALAGAAVEQFAVDATLEADGDAIAGFGLGALGLRRVGPVLVGDALDGLIDLGIGDFDHRLLHRERLEIGELNRRHHLDRNRIGQVGLAGEQLLDLVLFGRHGDLRLGRETKTAVGEDLRVGVADGLVDGLGHDRAAVHLLQMAYRHLAGAEAVELHLILEVDQLGVRLGIEIRCGNADLELVLQSLGEGFGDLHGVNLLPLAPGQSGPAVSNVRGVALQPAPVVRRTLTPPTGRPALQYSSCKRLDRALGAGGGTRTPTTFVTGT